MRIDRAFLDTVGLLALWDVRDQWHAAAEEAFAKLVAMDTAFVTTTFVLLECGNAAARRPFRLEVDLMRERLEAGGFLIIPTDTDWRQAWAAYRRGDADGAGIVDHISFAVMRRLGIAHAFTNDRHFCVMNFATLF
ncbi:MAG: type II toxin-antitoxin system VapC family toxin [Pirellulales bacterium]